MESLPGTAAVGSSGHSVRGGTDAQYTHLRNESRVLVGLGKAMGRDMDAKREDLMLRILGLGRCLAIQTEGIYLPLYAIYRIRIKQPKLGVSAVVSPFCRGRSTRE